MGGATITAAVYHQQQHHNSSETLLTSCILVAFICFILTGSINIALLSTAPVAINESLSVEYSQITRSSNPIYRWRLRGRSSQSIRIATSQAINTSFFFGIFFDDNEINIQMRFFAEIYQRVLQTGPTKDRHIAWWHKYFWTDFPFSFVRRQGTQNWDSETPKSQPIAPNTVDRISQPPSFTIQLLQRNDPA